MSKSAPIQASSDTHTTYGPPTCTPTPFDLSAPWPFAEGAQAIFLFATMTPAGMTLHGEWHPVDANPEGFLIARLDYEVAGDIDRLQVGLAPIFDCYMRSRDRDLQTDLMNSASLLAHLVEQHQTPQAGEWFERQWLGYETHRYGLEQGKS